MTNPSLLMTIEIVDGIWMVDAPWLKEPVTGATWHDAYWEAVTRR